MSKDIERFLADAREISLRSEEKQGIAKKLGIRVREKTAVRLEPYMYMSEKRFFSAASKIRLSPAERARSKEYILEAILHPHISWWLAPFKHFTSVVAALLIVLLAGGASMTYASESAMPGDMLYPVKLNISEPMQGMLARNSESQARFALKRAERRLREAEKLARSSGLDDSTKKMIGEKFKSHTEDMGRALEKMEAGRNRSMAGAISMDFEATLRGHSRLMKRMHKEKDGLQELEQAVHAARMQVEEIAVRVRMAEEKNDMHAMTTKHVEESMTKATAAIAGGENVSEEAKEALTIAENAMREAQALSDEPQAIDLMRVAIRNAKEAVMLAQVDPETNVDTPSEPTETNDGERAASLSAIETSPDADAEATAGFNPDEASAVMMMKVDSLPPPPPPPHLQEEEILPPPVLSDTETEDMEFSTEVRMYMTKKKLLHLKEAMGHLPPPMNPHHFVDIEARMDGAKQLLSIAEMQQEAGNAHQALDAADTALRHAHTAEENMEAETSEEVQPEEQP